MTTTETLYQACLMANLTIDSHESDLYILDTPAAREVVRKHQPGLLLAGSTFRDSAGVQWIDAPFAFDPFWKVKAR